MKPIFAWRMVLVGVGLVMMLPAAAGDPTHAAPPPPVLDEDDMAKLVMVRQQVLGAHPDLEAEEEKLKSMHDAAQSRNPPPTSEEKDAAFAEWKAYQKKMRAEMLKIDPTLAPVFARLDESRKHGTPPPFAPATK